MIKVLAFVFATFLSLSASAEAPLPACDFYQTVYSPTLFNEVQPLAANQAVTPDEWPEATRLNPRVEISANAYVGVTKAGVLVNVVRQKNRFYMFRLSGSYKIVDFFIASPGLLIAIADDGEVLQFDWALWREPVGRRVVRHRAGQAAGAACVLGALAFPYAAITDAGLIETLATWVYATLGVFTAQGVAGSHDYEVANRNPNGFRPIGVRLSGYRRSEYLYGHNSGAIVDYELISSEGRRRLSHLLFATPPPREIRSFNVPCEGTLRPASVDAKKFDYNL